MPQTIKQVLTIAGSDSGGGAGIQADLKAMSANGVFAMSVITAITAQNTEEVTDVFELPPSIIASQLDAVFDDFDVAAVKTGMLSSTAIVEIVVKMLTLQKIATLVVDPVMVSKSGHPLLRPEAVNAVKTQLLPLAFVVTPNIHEAQQLSGIQITSLADARRAAKVIHGFGCKHVLIKGGHLLSERATDLLYDGRFFNVLKGDLSLVGPRPALPSEVNQYSLADRRRLEVIPGITCIWQVSGRSDIPFPEQVKLDVQYIESSSFGNDILILLKTVPAVLLGRGAY